MIKRLSIVATIVVVIVGQFVLLGSGLVRESKALGTPKITKVSPSSPQPVGTCVTVRAKVDWDDDFRSMRMRFGHEGWQEEATAEFERTFCTDGYAPGWYKIRVEVASKGDNNWSNPTVAEASYQLTNTAEPTATPKSEIDCVVNTVSLSPSSPQVVGTEVRVDAQGWCSSGVRAMRVKVDGGIIYEIGAPSLTATWYTSDQGAGWHKVTVEVAGKGDNNWSQAVSESVQFQVTSKPQPTQPPTQPSTQPPTQPSTQPPEEPTQPSDDPAGYFSTGDVIEIGYDVYVMVNNQRRLVPNPKSLDALGISRSWINNRGLADWQLKQISKGADIPDVDRDPSGFQSFKDWIFPYTDPITPSTATPRPQRESGKSDDLTLTASLRKVNPGESVTVSWSGFNPSGNDWISLYPVGDQEEYVAWKSVYNSSGSLSFVAPQQAGRYRFGLFRNGSRSGVSNSFEVEVEQGQTGSTGDYSDGSEVPQGTTEERKPEKQSEMCEMGVRRAFIRPRIPFLSEEWKQHWFVLEISKEIREPYEIYFRNKLVPDDNTGVNHQGYLGETDETVYLGISGRDFAVKNFPWVLVDSDWKIEYPPPCEND